MRGCVCEFLVQLCSFYYALVLAETSENIVFANKRIAAKLFSLEKKMKIIVWELMPAKLFDVVYN